MKKIYLLFLLATVFSFNQVNAQLVLQPCPDTAVINGGGNKLTVIYDVAIDCSNMPVTLTTGAATWTLKNCTANNNTATYDLSAGVAPAIGGTFTIDAGFVSSCEYSDSVLPISDFDFLNASLRLYPNPMINSNRLNLKFETNTSAKISMYDVTGKLALSDVINNDTKKQLNTSSLTRGVYFLKVATELTSVTRKVVLMQ